MPAALFFVERQPTPGSPAAEAGLRAGDAVLRFGDARTIDDVASILTSRRRIDAEVMGRNGVVQERVIKPRVFDPTKPNSLFGCQITDICPVRFTPHPVLRGIAPTGTSEDDATVQDPEPEMLRSSNVVESVAFLRQLTQPRWHDEGGDTDSEQQHGEVTSPSARAGHTMVRFNHRAEAASAAPLQTAVDDDADAKVPLAPSATKTISFADSAADTLVEEPAVSGLAEFATYARLRWRSRCVLMTVSMVNLAHGCAFLAAPLLGSRAAAVFEDFHTELWRLSECDAEYADAEHADEGDDDKLRMARRWLDAVLADDNLTGLETADGMMDYDDDLDAAAEDANLTFGAFVRIALLVSFLELLLTVGGLALAMLPPPGRAWRRAVATPCTIAERLVASCQKGGERVHCAVTVLYPPLAMLLWVLLAGATMYCLAFRLEADSLLRRYWQCLAPDDDDEAPTDATEPSEWRGAHVFDSVGALATVCAGADASAVVSLFASCSLIGWRRVLRASMMAVGVLTALGGGLIASAGSVLFHMADERNAALSGLAAQGMVLVGLAMCPLGILGEIAARREQPGLLQLHAMLIAGVALALATLCVLTLVGGAESLRPSLERIVGDAAEPSEQRPTDGVDEVVGALQDHGLGVSAASVLALFLLTLNGSMSVVLRWILIGRIVLSEDEWHGEYERVLKAEGDGDDDDEEEEADVDVEDEALPEEWFERAEEEQVAQSSLLVDEDAFDDDDVEQCFSAPPSGLEAPAAPAVEAPEADSEAAAQRVVDAACDGDSVLYDK